ncbi:hypothetical protein SLT36_22830 [Aminobacter sp. BA135]|uniref:hypothetical protein n=1 Tax=Aminobacter sp. BA135 TaxID=537596 RepID=UPI003D797F97
MDTHPRAEDEGLPQHEASSQEPEAQLDNVAETVQPELIAAPELIANEEISAGDEAASESVAEAAADVELSAEELSTEAAVVPEAAVAPELAAETSDETEVEAEAPAAEEAAPVVLGPEELTAQAPEDAGPANIAAPSIAPGSVSESEFAVMVDDALEAVGGILLFKMRLDEAGEDRHVAAASIGDGARRQFLLLSLPVTGGKLKVESASRSNSPLAKLAEAYVGVVEAFRAAA